jgi:competence protein ComEA
MDWIYRLQQRLAITRRESIAILTLSALLFLGLVVREVQPPAPPPNPTAHEHMKARFEARTAMLPGANRPAAGNTGMTGDSAAASDALVVRMDLNTASAPALQQLPGIGPALSGRILAYRQSHGPFAEVADITRVRGIGPKTLERITPMLYVEADTLTAASH